MRVAMISAVGVLVALLATGCGGTETVTETVTVTTPGTTKTGLGPPAGSSRSGT